MTFRTLSQLIRPYHRGLLLLVCLALAEAGMALVLPLLVGQLGAQFLSVLPEAGRPFPLVIALLALLGLKAAVQGLSALLHARTAETILADLRKRLFDHMLSLPVPWHQEQERGSLMALATLETERLGHFITSTMVSLVPLLLTAGGAAVAMLIIDPALAFLVPLLVPAFFVMARLLRRLLRGLAQRIQAEHAATATRFEEMLDLVPALKSFAVEPAERAAHADGINRLKTLSQREAGLYARTDPALQFTVASAAVILLVMVGNRLQTDQLAPAETISFLMYVALLVRPIGRLASIYGQIQTARGTLRRLETVLSVTPEPPAAGPPYPRPAGDIRFEEVGFAYPDRRTAIRGMTLHVRPGEVVALTGPNGAGKSTAISLLLGFQTPDAGRILLDGQDIAMLPPDHLRCAIGFVPQTRYLRNASVRENIVFGRIETDATRIEAASRIAQAHDFILSLPQGYDTVIGDRGLRLSGGQQQRIALARALLEDPSILILDEATAMYDIEGEAAFIDECRGALAGRTVILITHRPASLALADRVLRMEGGCIVAEESRP